MASFRSRLSSSRTHAGKHAHARTHTHTHTHTQRIKQT
jgi:hypothetical protein